MRQCALTRSHRKEFLQLSSAALKLPKPSMRNSQARKGSLQLLIHSRPTASVCLRFTTPISKTARRSTRRKKDGRYVRFGAAATDETRQRFAPLRRCVRALPSRFNSEFLYVVGFGCTNSDAVFVGDLSENFKLVTFLSRGADLVTAQPERGIHDIDHAIVGG